MGSTDEFAFLSSLDKAKVASLSADIHAKCDPLLASVDASDDSSVVALNCCIGSVVCPDATKAVLSALESGEGLEDAYDVVTKRVERFGVMSQKVMEAGSEELVE